jgi:hypothetical protein
MLKITTDIQADALVFFLEGSLSGPWVREVERTWQKALDDQSLPRIRLELSGLTFVSGEGEELLTRLFAAGVQLTSSDVLTKSIVDAIYGKHQKAKS